MSLKIGIGDIVFSRAVKKSTKQHAPEIKFQGHAFSVLLGYVKPGQKEPEPEHIVPMFGMMGFLTFDDVSEFLGQDQVEIVMKKYNEKYKQFGFEALTPEERELMQKEVPEAAPITPAEPKILDMHGRPSEKSN